MDRQDVFDVLTMKSMAAANASRGAKFKFDRIVNWVEFFPGTVFELKKHVLHVECDFWTDCNANSVRSVYLLRFQISLPTQSHLVRPMGFSYDACTCFVIQRLLGYNPLIQGNRTKIEDEKDHESSSLCELSESGGGLSSQAWIALSRHCNISLTSGRSSRFSRQQHSTILHSSSVKPRLSAASGFCGRCPFRTRIGTVYISNFRYGRCPQRT